MSKEAKLTPQEAVLYEAIKSAASENRLATSEDLYLALYGPPLPDDPKKAALQVAPVLQRLRQKLPPGEITTKPGLGYFSDSATKKED